MEDNTITLLTGCTGYVGGRLIPLLEANESLKLRCMARHPEHVAESVSGLTEVVKGDVQEIDSLRQALTDVHTAYYLIHSMGLGDEFESADRQGARNFAKVAKEVNVKRIIYLGGLGASEDTLSRHLRSRQEVGEILKESGAQVIEFRASIIIGSGSLSFELVRALVNKLPVMVWPKWVSTLATPIAIEDVTRYLTEVLDHPVGENLIYEIGGPDQVSYGDVMLEFARQRGLRRYPIPIPFLSPYLSSLWLGLVTPVYASIGRHLIDSLRNPTVVQNNDALDAFSVKPRGLVEAIERALKNEDQEIAQTRWSDALSSSGKRSSWGGAKYGSRLIDSRSVSLDVPANIAFLPIERLGGKTGWYFGNILWKIRGTMDLLIGGVGLRRGRRDPENLKVGDVLDFWRVEAFEPNQRLLLTAEMKLPGRAWLEYEVTTKKGRSVIRQTAIFDPSGLLGLVYWYGIWPLHVLVFAGMLNGIKNEALRFAEKNKPESKDESISKQPGKISLLRGKRHDQPNA